MLLSLLSSLVKVRSIFSVSTGSLPEVLERRVSRTEVVDSDLDSQGLQLVEAVYRLLGLEQHDGLGDLERQLPRRKSVPFERAPHGGQEIRLSQLPC